MKWLSFFDEIFVLNLSKRQDRLLEITEHFEEYEIPFKRIESIENSNGAEGLRDTMLLIFEDAIDKGRENILVFEDDCEIIKGKEIFHDIMNKAIEQLPENYLMFFLGGQPTGGYSSFYSNNLLPVIKYYSTHSVCYSKRGIKEILQRGMEYPIDIWYVDVIQPLGNCYAVDPILTTQREGYSDIGKNEINWTPFIVAKHQQEINKLRSRW